MMNDYACNFEAMNQDVICDNFTRLKSGLWINELERKNIVLSDLGYNSDSVEILIGAPVKVPGIIKSDTELMITNMFVQEANVTDLWSFDILGIEDPMLRKNRAETDADTKRKFIDRVTINDEGRYEVELPWVDEHAPLPINREIAEKRLESTTNKLIKEGLWDEYDTILKEWTREGIVEQVLEVEVSKHGHYLPHRHVMKHEGSTKMRPVFDASARQKNYPSLKPMFTYRV